MNYEEITNRFEYKNGKLFYKTNTFKENAGKEAGCINKVGYKVVTVKGKTMLVHRIVWLMHYGNLPTYIDHIDGDKLNNCLSNLREASKSENSRNSKIKTTNKSGYKNVSWCKVNKKWAVQLTINYKNNHFGKYKNLKIACVIAELARHKYFGEFARNA
jgi:hypothetical protein